MGLSINDLIPGVDEILGDVIDAGPGQPVYPINFEQLPGFIQFQMENKNGSPVGERCLLPIPLGLNFQEGVNYEIGDLGVIGGTIRDFQQNGATLGDLRSVAENMTGQDAKDAVAAQISGVFGIKGRAGSRTVPNPNTSAVFKQVNLREYTMQYKMIPTSHQEYLNIKKVIRFFRMNMYPESKHGQIDPDRKENEVGLVYYGYAHPQSCRIEVYLGGQLQYPLFLPCKIRAVQHQYNASAGGVMRSGNQYSFSEVDLSISLVEPKTLERQLIERGDY